MQAMQKLTLVATAERRMGLPRGWLKVQVSAGVLPHVRADDRFYVHVPTIERLLLDRARGTHTGKAKT